MENLRTSALNTLNERQPIDVASPSKKVSEYFQNNTFSVVKMQSLLSPNHFKSLQKYLQKGDEQISPALADAVATAMKNWAIEHGATHYTHWFQPLTGATAEKHDTFFQFDGIRGLEEFKGSTLVRQEPDASSFPSGGLRNTFEARGYTAWDPTSNAFLMESGNGKTLCIPTVFVSYTGEVLDHKTPLLKALHALDKSARAVCQYFDRNVTSVKATLGWEQEFFLVDTALFNARPDLVLTGRTVVGNQPAKGQQLDDHYFGTISSRVQRYLQDLETEAYKIGIPIKTRHNEVAPSQFEIAPIFEEVNVAVDHNLILMDIMKKVARRHNFKVLFHEKPFARLNGSGKHNNWSMMTNTGQNLLAPSSKAKVNLQFLTFFINTIKAVHDYAPLLRASIASSGNDYRLGANEAPPAIISIFIGSTLTKVLQELENNADVVLSKGDNLYIKLGIDQIPAILLDNTDRNRTSPFAFTGNKFELRAVGASTNPSLPMMVLNAIVAKQLQLFKAEVDAKIAQNEKREVAIIDVLRGYIKASKSVLFEGDGYSKSWAEEAQKRGLENVKDTPRALDAYLSKSSVELLRDLDILNEPEIHARHEVMLENYIMKIQIEARIMGDLALNCILPTAIKYQNELLDNLVLRQKLGLEAGQVEVLAKRINRYINSIYKLVDQMIKTRKEINQIEDLREKAIAYADRVKADYFESIRWNVDKLELFSDDKLWPLPKYRELLFLR